MNVISSSSALNHHSQAPSYCIIGVGNAGVNFLDQLLLSYPSFPGLIAVNNDAESLEASVVRTQILLSSSTPFSFSLENLLETAPYLAQEIEKTSLVILLGGLGGDFASMLLPHLLALSKTLKKTTLACLTLPFSFEGKRNQSIAATCLSALERKCDGLLVIDNNRLCVTKSSTIPLGETFSASDEAVVNIVPALLSILLNRGPFRITRSRFLNALQCDYSKSCFGYGQARGANRLHEALEQVLKNPLLDRGRVLGKASNIFLLLSGPKDISFAEVQIAVQEIERLAGEDHDIQMSLHPQEEVGAPLKIFLLAILEDEKSTVIKSQATSSSEPFSFDQEVPKFTHEPTFSNRTLDQGKISNTAQQPLEKKKVASLEIKELFPQITYQDAEELYHTSSKKTSSSSKRKPVQGALNLKPLQRGRFDKSEPTIVEGEDLDIPTYLRLGLKLN